MIAKVIELDKGVEVIVKKVIIKNDFGITLNFVAELEEKTQVNTTLTLEYGSEELRDGDFNNMNKENLTHVGKTLSSFKNILLNEKHKD